MEFETNTNQMLTQDVITFEANFAYKTTITWQKCSNIEVKQYIVHGITSYRKVFSS